jgi:hypothetical protein
MSALLGALGLVIAVVGLMQAFGLSPRALQVMRTARNALDVIYDSACDDARKEVLLQGYSVALLKSCLDLLIRGVGAMALPIGLLWTLECAGVLSLDAVLALAHSWAFVLGVVIAGVAAFWFLKP